MSLGPAPARPGGGVRRGEGGEVVGPDPAETRPAPILSPAPAKRLAFVRSFPPGSAGEADRLVTRPPCYVFAVALHESDVLRFEQLAADGRAALAGGDAA